MPTVGVSLVREHTQRIRPPRSLWVPFALGRPFGAPDEPEFQLDVLRAALAVLGAPAGPAIVDYPHDAPSRPDDADPWSCTLPLPPLPEAGSVAERLAQGLESETAMLLPWYAESLRRRGRTAFGASRLDVETTPEMAAFLAGLAAGDDPAPPAGTDGPRNAVLRAIADDLKTLYLEAAAAQPGKGRPEAHELNRWLYHETRLGDVLYRIRDRLAAVAQAAPSDAPRLPPVALIPNVYRERPS